MSSVRTVFAASWLLWGALLPIFGGLVLAARLDLDLWVGALVGGVVAVPLSLWGIRLAEREAERQIRQEEAAAAASPAPTGTTSQQSNAWDWERVWPVLVGLGILALGVAGLVSGTAVVILPGGHPSAEAASWTVPGVWGRVVASGLVLFGLGWLWASWRAAPRRRWAAGLIVAGFILFVMGNLAAAVVKLIA